MNTSILERTALAKLEIPFEEAVEAFASVLPHTSSDKVTPVLTALSITVDEEGLAYLIATDRYSVGRYQFSTTPLFSEAVTEIRVSKEAALWISKLKTAGLRHWFKGMDNLYFIRIAIEPGTAPSGSDSTIKVDLVYCLSSESSTGGTVEVTQSFNAAPAGNFPPVNRLFAIDSELHSPVSITFAGGQLGKFVKSFSAIADAKTMTFQGASSSSPNKPGPMLVTISDRFNGLVQPHLMAR